MLHDALADITFDSQDANLFLVDDARLEADALRHSVLPRLRVVTNAAVTLVREIYGIDTFEDSSIWMYPNFREKRYKNEELRFRYGSAFVGIGGQGKAKWPTFSRWDGKPVTYLPFRFGFRLTPDGLNTTFDNGIFRLHITPSVRLCHRILLRLLGTSSNGSKYAKHYRQSIDSHCTTPFSIITSFVPLETQLFNFVIFTVPLGVMSATCLTCVANCPTG